jgi:hypothetical protein
MILYSLIRLRMQLEKKTMQFNRYFSISSLKKLFLHSFSDCIFSESVLFKGNK